MKNNYLNKINKINNIAIYINYLKRSENKNRLLGLILNKLNKKLKKC